MSVVITPAATPQHNVVQVVNPLATSTVATFEDAYHRRLSYCSGFSGTSAVHLAKQARLVLSMQDTGLSVWRIPFKTVADPAEMDADPADARGWEKVLVIELNARTNLISSAISDNGKWLVVSDYYETKLFSLELNVSVKRCISSLLLKDPLPGQGEHCQAKARSRVHLYSSATPTRRLPVNWCLGFDV